MKFINKDYFEKTLKNFFDNLTVLFGRKNGLATLDKDGVVPEGQISSNIVRQNDLEVKVDKETGKGLSTNDFTTTEKNKLSGIAENATNVTETTVSNWGFTKNTGTYIKPSSGIPKTDLASSVQTSLGKADTALQSHQSLENYSTKGNTISGLSVSGKTITYTKGDGTTGTITTQDTTYSTATSSKAGLVKSATTGTTANRNYNVQVNTDGTMKVNVPWTNTTYSNATTSSAGLMSATDKTSLENIKKLIPDTATETNQLADKEFVNSSIATNTANFIGTFESVESLNAYSGTKTNNDYAFVVGTDTAGNTQYTRYKWNGTEWKDEYVLNNSSFTAEQWASIQSGITSELVESYDTHIESTENPHNVTKEQVGLGNVDNTSDTDKPVSTAQQTALDGKLSTSGGTMTGNISYKGTKATFPMIKFIDNTADANGNGIKIGGGGATVIGGGESADTWAASNVTSGGSEVMAVTNDQDVKIVTNLQSGLANGKTFTFGTDGILTSPNGFKGNLSGNATNVTGTVAIANGGTGATTASAALTALNAGMTDGLSNVTDNTDIITSNANGRNYSDAVNKTYFRKATYLWNYIKSKISTVLGLTATNYSGTAAYAGSIGGYYPKSFSKTDNSGWKTWILINDVTSDWNKTSGSAKHGFIGQVTVDRGNSTAIGITAVMDVACAIAYNGKSGAKMLYSSRYGNDFNVLPCCIKYVSDSTTNYYLAFELRGAGYNAKMFGLFWGTWLGTEIKATDSKNTMPAGYSIEKYWGQGGCVNTSATASKANLLNASTSRPTTPNIAINGTGGLQKFLATSSMTTNKPTFNGSTADSHIIHMCWDTTAGYDSQLAVKNGNSPRISVRGQSAGTWGDWLDVAMKGDIPTSLPASDVSDWAKSSTKPSYTATGTDVSSEATVTDPTITNTITQPEFTASATKGAVELNRTTNVAVTSSASKGSYKLTHTVSNKKLTLSGSFTQPSISNTITQPVYGVKTFTQPTITLTRKTDVNVTSVASGTGVTITNTVTNPSIS